MTARIALVVSSGARSSDVGPGGTPGPGVTPGPRGAGGSGGCPGLQETGEADQLGGKAVSLLRMARLGLRVPPALVLTTDVWRLFQRIGGDPQRLWAEIGAELDAELVRLGEAAGGLRLGDPRLPLVVSVRSGAAVSMPGMLDTLLNVGLNEDTVVGLAERLGDRRCALDCYRRFLLGFSTLAQHAPGTSSDGVDPVDAGDSGDREPADRRLGPLRAEATPGQRSPYAGTAWSPLASDRTPPPIEEELDEAGLRARCRRYRSEIARQTGCTVPEDPQAQLRAAIEAVLRSWDNPRAQEYRRLHGIAPDLGTAVTVQAMVFGNLNTGKDSAAGAAFSRDPSTGLTAGQTAGLTARPATDGGPDATPLLFGEFLPGAQGSDIVSGVRTPRPLSEMPAVLPSAYAELVEAARRLEDHLGDLQEIEFTVERGQLYLLQTRTGRRSARAMVRIAYDLLRSGRIDGDEAVRRIEPVRLAELLQPQVDRDALAAGAAAPLLVRGLAASPGAASGRLAFSVADVKELRRRGEPAIFARTEASTEDILGIKLAAGVLTTRGGITSHAAVVARGLGRCAVVGASGVTVDYAAQELRTREHTLGRGEIITLDGNSGQVLLGAVPLRAPHLREDACLAELLRRCDARARLQVGALVRTPAELLLARDLGVGGAALCTGALDRRLAVHLGRWQAALKAPPGSGAAGPLDAALATGFSALLRAAPGPIGLLLLDPAASAELLEDTGGSNLGELPELALRIWGHELRALDAALRECGPVGEVRIFLPAPASPAALAQVRALMQTLPAVAALPLGAMVCDPGADIDALARCADRLLVDLRAFTAATLALDPEDLEAAAERAVGSGACAQHPLRTLDEKTVERRLAVVLEAVARRVPVTWFDAFELAWDERTITAAHRLGVEGLACPPVRAPIARFFAARAALKERTVAAPGPAPAAP